MDGDGSGNLPSTPLPARAAPPPTGDASGFLPESDAPASIPDPKMRKTSSLFLMGLSSLSEDALGPPPVTLAFCPPPLAGSHTERLAAEPTRAHSCATLVLPPGSMEVSARCVALGSPHDSIWIHPPFPSPSSLLRWGLSHCYEQHPRGFCSPAGSDVDPPEGSDRGGSSFRLGPRFLQLLLSRPKE